MAPRRSCREPSSVGAAARAGVVVLGVLLALARPGAAQSAKDTDRIDITGRQNLTLGSGARAYGMGGAFLARADDATAASWNPAGLSYLRLPEVSLVGNSNSFRIEHGLDSDDFHGRAVDFAALTWPIGIGQFGGAVQLSYQRAISFDGRRSIRHFDAAGQLDTSEDGRSNGGFDVYALGTGLRLTRSLRLGFTVNRWTNGYTQSLQRTVLREDPPTKRPQRDFDLDFRPSGWNFNLGAMWSPVEPLNLAAVYKTAFSAGTKLDKARRDYWGPLGSPEEITTNAGFSDAVDLEFPSAYGLGISWRPRDTVTLSADFTRTRWSQARITNYFDLAATGQASEDGVPAVPPGPNVYPYPLQYPSLKAVPASDNPSDPAALAGQRDSAQVRLGVEWVLIRGGLKVPLRAGYFKDRQILPDVAGDAPWFNGFTGGVGLVLHGLLFDVAYVYEVGKYSVADAVVGGGDFDVPPSTTPVTVRNAVRTGRLYASISYRFDRR